MKTMAYQFALIVIARELSQGLIAVTLTMPMFRIDAKNSIVRELASQGVQ